MKFFYPLLHFLFQIGYFGPFVMGVMDSSFLILPFGNDLLVVSLVARHHHGVGWYVVSAAIGSSVGALLLSVATRKLGEEKIRKIAGEKRYKKLARRVGKHSAFAVALAGLAPPPFPFTSVIAAVSLLDYPVWRILVVNFLARGIRFTVLAILALKFGKSVLAVTKSAPFEWTMIVFVGLCLVASGFSLWQWMRRNGGRAQERTA